MVVDIPTNTSSIIIRLRYRFITCLLFQTLYMQKEAGSHQPPQYLLSSR